MKIYNPGDKTFETDFSTMQKINPVNFFNLCHWRFVFYIYFLLFEENHQNWISRAGEKFLQRSRSFFRKMVA